VRAVAARAHNVHQMGLVGDVDLGRELAHHLRRGGDLANGFLLDAQAGDQCRHHHRRHLAGHDHAHQVQHLVVKNFAVFDGALQRLLRGDLAWRGHDHASFKGGMRWAANECELGPFLSEASADSSQ
jgi:hypothetical protein